ncbi:clusterin associated protein 1 [Angomonas deanei]|uniref:Clusterin-associated protein-1, putative n=1 Tax=Angomonas deanei TaxID=59799 RepID=S9VEY0_9TRYP|nr:clusterin associated protein 1 [Angomonas deanei]EPY39433.1 clusterin associated protein 1 [Angomonas deanei]CAD2217318.1 Clusterin-associated protein-1, putative [Angomonas deanei]|eukprot:EPY35325.1 clusterin associated protein 1 [Angomonas deanei]
MSFRELRSFAEAMRILGYPSLISMESFKEPNVELVADCMYWLIMRYEPSAEVTYNIERESDRVFFFKQVCEVALSKGRMKLNIKKLYQADGHAVQEMLKLANVLKKAMQSTDAEDLDFAGLQQMAAQKNVHDGKAVQQLCSDLTAEGSSLFFLIDEEIDNRPERQKVLSRATEVGEFERKLRELLANVSQQVDQLQQSITNLSADETNLEQKIENKKVQLERAQKRYKSLMAVRPAFIEEYDKHEADLQVQFVQYLEQYRNVEYLEYQLAKYNASEDALLEEQQTKLKVMRERLLKEELKAIRSDGGRALIHRDSDDDEGARVRNAEVEGSSESESDSGEEVARPQNAIGRNRPVNSGGVRRTSNVMMDSDDSDDSEGVVNTRKMRPAAADNVNSGRPAVNPMSRQNDDDDDSDDTESDNTSDLLGSDTDDSDDDDTSDDSDI